jgi:outer membrane protein assembly factor BamB
MHAQRASGDQLSGDHSSGESASGGGGSRSPTGETSPYVAGSASGSAAELLKVLDEYLEGLQAGETPDRERLLREHPELAGQLEPCLAGMDFIHRAAKPAGGGAPAQLGDFRIIREIGRGGMGVVYEAEQLSLKRRVALKVLRFGVGADVEVMKRFQREAETVAQLHHTNIVPIHAVGELGGVHFYAMQLIDGKSLAAVLAEDVTPEQNIKPDFRRVAGWGLQAAEALAHAHHRGVIHRDIKPSNLILAPDGTVWLTDFGLAKRADEVTLTAAGVLMGTPRYMSPEQAAAAKQPIDHRTDIYSLGATLYELATGKPVFESQTPQGVITQILSAEPVAPRLIQGTMPRDLETIILKCLAKEPAGRYQQARELADDLRAYLENRSIKARRPRLLERAVRWARKNRRSTAVTVVTAAASILIFVAIFFGWRNYQDSLLARLTLTREGPSRVAEVLDERGEVVIPSFPVPTPQAVVLPAGRYGLRFSGPGVLSETWQIRLEPKEHATLPVNLLDRHLWTPFEITGPEPMRVTLNGQPCLLVATPGGWALRNGAHGRDIWTLTLPEKPPPSPHHENLVKEEWASLLQWPRWDSNRFSDAFRTTGNTAGLVAPSADLNGDGMDDVIFASRVSPSLLGVSGKDGTMLWWFRSAPSYPKNDDAANDPFVPEKTNEVGGVIGQPVLVNLDGEPVVVAAMVNIWHNSWTKSEKWLKSNGNRFRLEAIAARSGKALWRTELDLNVPRVSNGDGSDSWRRFPGRLEVIKLDGREVVLLPVHTTLSAFDVKTGKEAWPAYQRDAYPVRAPLFGDLDGDREPDALFVDAKGDYTNEVTVRAVTLKTRAVLWERALHHAPHMGRDAELTWIADLDGDGACEILTAARDDWDKPAKHWFGIEALDGATGKTRWQHRATRFSGMSGGGMPALRLTVGDDLDGDGHRDVFVATLWTAKPGSGETDHPQIEALSGKDGRVLWRRHLRNTEELPSRLDWWQTGDDGWPQLVVPIANGPGGQAMTYMLEASTGRITHTLPEVADPRVADVNGDGMPDLYHIAASPGSRRFVVFRGIPPHLWRRPGNWQPAPDYDGDGINDFLELRYNARALRPTARSGTDGRVLWQAETNALVGPLHIEVDGDGVSDLIVGENFHEVVPNSGGREHTVFKAFSGKDGRLLWTGQHVGIQVQGGSFHSHWGPRTDYRYPLVGKVDLDGDGRQEIVIAGTSNTGLGAGSERIMLAAVSSKDGSFLWRIPILERAFTGHSLIDRHLFHDLDGDGVRDVVLWVPERLDKEENAQGAKLAAFSGRDGKPLWADDAPPRFKVGPAIGGIHGPFAWPRVAIGDLDGDGKPSVVLTTFDREATKDNKVPCELIVLDGRTGRKQWSRPWTQHDNWSELHFWPPLLVNVNGDGKRLIALGQLWNDDKGAAKVCFYDAKGELRDTVPANSVYRGDVAWGAFDLDGDGKESVVFVGPGGVTAYRPHDKKTLWASVRGFFPPTMPRWGADAHLGHGSFGPGTGFSVQLIELRRGRENEPATLVVSAGRTPGQAGQTALYGLNAVTGDARWRCDIPQHEKNAHIFETGALDSPNVADAPLVITHHDGGSPTLLQRPLPTNADGSYRQPRGEPVSFTDIAEEGTMRPLPWVRDISRFNPLHWDREEGTVKKFLGVTEPLPILIFLGTLFWWMGRGRWGRVSVYLVFFVLVTAANAGLMLWVNARHLEEGDRYSWHGWYWGLYVGAIATGTLTLVGAIALFIGRGVRRLARGAART